MPNIKDLQFERELQKFKDATRGLFAPQPGKRSSFIPITRGTMPPQAAPARVVSRSAGSLPFAADRQPHHRALWTDHRIEELKKLWASGYSASSIADRFGLTRSAVLGKINRLGLIGSNFNKQPRPNKPRPPRKTINALLIEHEARTAEPAPASTEFLGIPFNDLEPQHCRYPRGEETYLFCGQPKMEGSSYCPAHHACCYTKPPSREASKFVFIPRRVS